MGFSCGPALIGGIGRFKEYEIQIFAQKILGASVRR